MKKDKENSWIIIDDDDDGDDDECYSGGGIEIAACRHQRHLPLNDRCVATH